MSYAAIAREKAALVERTGLLGEGMFGSQIVSRFFIGGFATAAQRDAWQSRVVSVAISEPRVGAHPKLLTTHAKPHGDGFRITGEKAWVTNGPLADVFIVLAITSVEAGRKRYSMFLVARDTPGLSIDEAEQYRALAPSRHCGVKLDDCYVPSSALLGSLGAAYEAMALPFRDVEDAVGTFGLLGAFRFVLSRLTSGDEAAVSLGGLIGLTAVFAEAASAVVAALDADNLAGQAPTSIGLRVLAGEMLQRARAHREAFGPADEPTLDRVFADLDTALSVARGPRQVRQARLGSGKAA
ncbi:MAG TPA: acyl-CoA dehydrogenase family protein [Acetobacteraceae bacterium]|nr:acyl-CoA dehydrogenase family protein [Acetobacteraceae bacterium]